MHLIWAARCPEILVITLSEGLVYHKHTGDMIGFVDYGGKSLTTISKQKESLASSALGFYLRGRC